MEIKATAQLVDRIRENNPLIHCITNYVTANTVANGLLAVGASPVMADSPLDAAEITARAKAVLFNMGTFSKDRCKTMLISGQEAGIRKLPVVLDPVGAGSTDYRLKNALQMLRQFRFAAIRGNASEISSLVYADSATMKIEKEKGVDSVAMSPEDCAKLGRIASEKFSCAVVITGKTDVVCCKEKVAYITNGVPMLSKITGTGCLASGLVASACAVSEDADYFYAAVCGTALIGVVGELAAKTAKGTGSLYVNVLDELTGITSDVFMKHANIETRV